MTALLDRRVTQVMGMPVSLAVRGTVPEAAWAEVITELRWVDWVFSLWKPDSAISRLARGEITLADCPAEVAEVIALGEAAEAASGGAFSVWLPTATGTRTLDPTGVVKGWAVERAARHLAGVDFALSAGGDMVCRSRGQEAWQVGVEDPADRTRLIARIPVWNGAVATSGTAARGAHLLDARDGSVPQTWASVTVVADSLTCADIDATASYALGDSARSWLVERGRHGLLVPASGTPEVY